MAELNGDGVRVRQACYALGVSASGFYEWKTRAPSARSIRHAWLTDLIGQVHGASYGTYGRPRVLAELQRAHGVVVGHNTVALLMRRAGISGLPLRRRAKRVPSQKTVTDLVKRQFTADGPEPAAGHRHHRAPHPRGQALLLRGHRRLQPPRRRLGHRQHAES